jgi:hypothetical protein
MNMRIFDDLGTDNFILYAARHYNNPHCVDTTEFYDDLNRFKYIKRLLIRYKTNGDLQERLILNHIIIIFNMFGIEASYRMLWYKIPKKHWGVLKPMLIYLNYMTPEDKLEIPLDTLTIERLRHT